MEKIHSRWGRPDLWLPSLHTIPELCPRREALITAKNHRLFELCSAQGSWIPKKDKMHFKREKRRPGISQQTCLLYSLRIQLQIHSVGKVPVTASPIPLPPWPGSEGLILSLRYLLVRRHIPSTHLWKSNCTLKKDWVYYICLLSFPYGHHWKCHFKCIYQEQTMPLISPATYE